VASFDEALREAEVARIVLPPLTEKEAKAAKARNEAAEAETTD
jgi:hypothetical protein